MVVQVVPLQPKEDHVRVDIATAAYGGPHTGAGGCTLKEAAAHEEPTQVQAPGRAVAHGEKLMQEQDFWQVLWGIHAGAVHS